MYRDKKTGYSVCLGDDVHKVAIYRRKKDKVLLEEARMLTSEELRALARKSSGIAACFSPRTIYADIGDFSCVSNEATQAHIRSTIDKTGLFNEDYTISFKKIHDIDGVRGKFSYVAVPLSDINKIALLDEKETFLDTYCPIEASLASMVALKTREMTITIFEDQHYVRIIGAKHGAIYYLITINKLESFDLLVETVSGINEMVSLLKNSYNEKVHCIYAIGIRELSINDLEQHDIHAEAFQSESNHQDMELPGTIHADGYDLTPKTYKRLRKLATYSRYSIGASLMLIVISLILFGLGLQNAHTARLYEDKVQQAQSIYMQNLQTLERDYKVLCTELDFTNINEIISMYNDFEAEPKLYTILGTITRHVPENSSLTRIEVSRPGIDVNTNERIVRDESMPRYSTQTHSLHVKIDGLIESPYPLSKKTFSRFLSNIQETYTVNNATFQNTQESASFSVECETKL